MEIEAARQIGAGLATIGLAGVGVGIGIIFGIPSLRIKSLIQQKVVQLML